MPSCLPDDIACAVPGEALQCRFNVMSYDNGLSARQLDAVHFRHDDVGEQELDGSSRRRWYADSPLS